MDERGERPRRMRLTESERLGEPEGAGAVRPQRTRTSETENVRLQRSTSVSEAGSTRQERPRRTPSAESAGQESGAGSLEQKLLARKRRKRNRILAGFGIGLLGIYAAVAVYFGFHFYEGTEIYGIDCSQKTAEVVKAEVAKRLGDYRLEIKERGEKSEYLNAEQIRLAFVDDSSINQMLKAQHAAFWPVMMLLKHSDAAVAFSYDQDAAVQAFSTLDCMNPLYVTAPEDAYVRTTDTGFEVAPEVLGTTLNAGKTRQALLQALDTGATVLVLEDEDCYVNPQRYQEDEKLQEEAEKKSELAKAYITYDFGDRKELVNAPVIADWIVTRADGAYVIDEVAVTDYVEQLAAKYDTFGLTREFYTSLGTTVTLSGGDYGWCMDQDATVIDLLNALADGYQGTLEPEYLYTAKSRDANDIGDTYVEICISQQRMWCYEYGTCIVDTPVVTGNPNKGNATPAGGVWAIDAMKRNAVLVGEGYQSPVDFWMPFNGNIGIHDMQTRAYFGGTIYLTNGSHGCVNTPYAQAEAIFNAVSVGTPVIVYE